MKRCAIVVWLLVSSPLACADALERLTLERLKATHAAVALLQARRQPVQLASGYQDVRAAIHVHSHWSHDSRAPIEEVVAGAKAAGVKVILFTEHPAPHYEYFTQGHRGTNDGVLLIPGAETGGFLAFPQRSIQQEKTATPQEFAVLVRRSDGLVFLSHLEERMDWEIAGLTGTEIYNTHADVKDERRLLAALRSPLGFVQLAPLFRAYPQEAFAALQDYPADYLRRFDELCQKAHLTGVAANDAHHNTGIVLTLKEGGRLQIDDLLGKKQGELSVTKVPLLLPLVLGKKPGETIFRHDLDPYERSLRHVSTHLLLPTVDEPAVRAGLKAGRAYVAFDWMADPSGFVFQAVSAEGCWPMGSELAFRPGLRLQAEAPLAGSIRLCKDGKVLTEVQERTFAWEVRAPGVYRLEVWLQVADERRPWILANPIFVRPPG